MKILIDEGLSTLGKLTGIGNVSYNLWKHLQKITHCDITNYNYLAGFPRIIRRQAYIIMTNLRQKLNKTYDIIHYQNYYTPKLLGKAINVSTIHDLTTFKFPDTLPKIYNLYIQKAIIKSFLRTSAIIVPSYSIKEELLTLFNNLNENHIFVCLNGVNDIYFSTKNNFKSIHNSKEEYFLYVGTLEKRKNIAFMIQTFLYTINNSIIDKNNKLVLVGKLGFGSEEFKSFLKHPNIRWYNYVENENIIDLYKNSKALIMPSLYEGFGIPVAEAMILGVPIIASDIPTNIEFNNRHNKQLFLFKPDNAEQLVELLRFIDKNKDIKTKINYGNTSIYSYDRVAEDHYKIYKQLLS